ncbi:polyprenyl synthetase family protein [Neobacillus sp. Marseille-QA0830]
MKEAVPKNSDTVFRLSEEKARHYFDSLYLLVSQKNYVSTLLEDMQAWKKNHIHYPFFNIFSKTQKPNPEHYQKYIQWLNSTDKLDAYLERSISYIYMRDLGKALDVPDTWTKIRSTVDGLKNHLTANHEEKAELMSLAGLYRWSQKEGIESAIIWLLDKLKKVSLHIPSGMDSEHAVRKLIKIIAGVVMNVIDEIEKGISNEERADRLDKAIRLGYSYGLTYPFIDDLLDANVLTETEKKQYSKFIRTALLTGRVPNLEEWSGEKLDLIRYIHRELGEAFEYIRVHQQKETAKLFFEQAFVFFQSQEMDRQKDLANGNYSNEELYIPIILKSASSRLIVRSVISAPPDEGYDQRTFYYGIYNQLADDFADMFDDLGEGRVTPYTYFIKYHKERPDLVNPFELYWAVIYYLIHHVYRTNPLTREVILDRAINGLKRFKERQKSRRYEEVMELLATGLPKFYPLIQRMVRKANDVDFFDKLLRDHVIQSLKNERSGKEEFLAAIEDVRKHINQNLSLSKNDTISTLNVPLIDAANYSLNGNGKRLRPVITYLLGVNGYGLDPSAMMPLLRSLEYMHTASLIFDDLPSQDNAPIRRGRPTLHIAYNMAIAELSGLFLTQKATEEQASLEQFDAKAVLQLIRYSAKVTGEICMGQTMDLESKGKSMTLEQLNLLSFYKTGLAFEASLVMPAILAQADNKEMDSLKKFARHAGIAFQIKDDLLDVEGSLTILGKSTGMDVENNNSTFVSILGLENARKAMWDHYCYAEEALRGIPRNVAFLKHFLNYIINRDH